MFLTSMYIRLKNIWDYLLYPSKYYSRKYAKEYAKKYSNMRHIDTIYEDSYDN